MQKKTPSTGNGHRRPARERGVQGDGRLGRARQGCWMTTYPAVDEDVERLVVARIGVIG